MKKKATQRQKNKSVIATPTVEEQQQLLNLYNQGLFVEAVENAEALIAIFPDYAFAWKILGASLLNFNCINESLVANKRAIQLMPNEKDVYFNLGIAFKRQSNLEEAEKSYRLALKINPSFAEGYNNLGTVLNEKGDLKNAEKSYRRALELNPKFASAYCNLGNVFKAQGYLDEAKKSYFTALDNKCDYADPHYNLGNLFFIQNNLKKAEEHYVKALAINSKLAQAYSNLGSVFSKQKNFEKAEKNYRNALDINPNDARSYYELGNIFFDKEDLQQAMCCYQNSLNHSPKNCKFIVTYIFISKSLCKWNTNSVETILLSTYIEDEKIDFIEPFQLLVIKNVSYLHQYNSGWTFANLSYFTPVKIAPLTTKITHTHQKLRIGYLSADFHTHATVHLMVGVLENRNIENFDVYLYSYGVEVKDASRSRIEKACEVFRNISELSDDEAAQQILADEIDILA